MKTLIKRLFGITRLEDEIKALEMRLIIETLLRHYMMKEREAQFGDWKPKKNGKGFYRRIKYPLAMPLWRTETAQSLPPCFLTDEEQWERESNL